MNEGTDRSGAWASASAGRITPADVQRKQFRTARLGGGYRMREVDEFLDQVTDALSSLIAENERLRRQRPAASSPSPVAASAGDRAAIDAFLQREKGFLQSLGTLVQEHAEDLKAMVRAARSSAISAADRPVEASAAASAAPIASTDASAEGPLETAEAGASEPLGAEETTAVARAGEGGEDASGDEHDAGELAETIEPRAEEPIRLDEPQPARSQRTEAPDDLRELFWGEE